jgi:hypothetical protein
MSIAGYLTTGNAVIFAGLEHTMCHLYFFRRMLIMCPCRPLNKRSLVVHWGKCTAAYISQEYSTVLLNTDDADHAGDIRDF